MWWWGGAIRKKVYVERKSQKIRWRNYDFLSSSSLLHKVVLCVLILGHIVVIVVVGRAWNINSCFIWFCFFIYKCLFFLKLFFPYFIEVVPKKKRILLNNFFFHQTALVIFLYVPCCCCFVYKQHTHREI